MPISGYLRLPDILLHATAAVKIANALEWRGQPPKIAAAHWGICTPI